MKRIKKEIFEACKKIENRENKENVQKSYFLSGEDIAKYLGNCYQKGNVYYFISPEEKEPVLYYLENPEVSYNEVQRKFGVKTDTIKRRMEAMGIPNDGPRLKRKYNRDAFKLIDTVEDAYWLGFILADGYLNEDRGFLRIKLAEKDEEHLKKFARYMQEENVDNSIKHDIGGAYTKDNICSYIEFSSRDICNNLVKQGIRQNKSGKEIPQDFSDFELKKAYVRGMIDGDGHVEDGYFKYVGSLESCQYMKDFFGKWYEYSLDKKYIYPKDSIFSFEIRSKKVNSILKEIYETKTDAFLERKNIIVKNF